MIIYHHIIIEVCFHFLLLLSIFVSKPEILQSGHNNNLMSNIGAIISYSSYIIDIVFLIYFIKDMKTKTRCFWKELRWNARGFIDLKQTLCSNQMSTLEDGVINVPIKSQDDLTHKTTSPKFWIFESSIGLEWATMKLFWIHHIYITHGWRESKLERKLPNNVHITKQMY